MADEMTAAQALSVLNQMKVEQQTLGSLWKQFSVALSQVEALIIYVENLHGNMPTLREERQKLVDEMANLGPIFDGKKQTANAEEAKHRESLQEETRTYAAQAADARERAIAAQKELISVEKRLVEAKQKAESELKALDERLVKARSDAATLAGRLANV